jgi:CubicO group peptidase (beta-lactamase class C family)
MRWLFPKHTSSKDADLPERIAALTATIGRLMKVGGAAGVSVGLMHHGKPMYHDNYGFRDIQKRLPLTEDSIFPTGSLTKAIVAAGLGILVEEGKATWETLVKDILPDYHIKDRILQNCTTVADLLCHRTGMSGGEALWIGTENNVLIGGENSMKYLNSQTRSASFRGQFRYCNLGYELAGHVIEQLSGVRWSEFLLSRIIQPLGMKRTSFTTPPKRTDNVVTSYNTLDDGTPTPITACKLGDNGFGGACGGMRSCVSDLLRLYSSFLQSFNDQFAHKRTATDGSPLKQVISLMSSHIPLNRLTSLEASYGLGWARVQLPGTMGAIGLNPSVVPGGMPVTGKGTKPELVFYHQGSLPGALACVMLIPRTETAIVVLSNSLTLNDTPDWIAQLILEEVLAVPKEKRNDFLHYAEISAQTALKWHSDTSRALQQARKSGTSPRPLQDYVRTYWDDAHIFKIVVTEEHGVLYWAFQGLKSEKFRLHHYEDDTFTWLQPRNDLVKRGRWVGQDAEFWKAAFMTGEKGTIEHLFWVHTIGMPAAKFSRPENGTL